MRAMVEYLPSISNAVQEAASICKRASRGGLRHRFGKGGTGFRCRLWWVVLTRKRPIETKIKLIKLLKSAQRGRQNGSGGSNLRQGALPKMFRHFARVAVNDTQFNFRVTD